VIAIPAAAPKITPVVVKTGTTLLPYDLDFFTKYKWCSCFECDKIFSNLDELELHQKNHILKESDALPIRQAKKVPRMEKT
jgi:hypothetical protein